MEIEELYQEVILDHSRRPRNFGELPDAAVLVHGDNPACGDERNPAEEFSAHDSSESFGAGLALSSQSQARTSPGPPHAEHRIPVHGQCAPVEHTQFESRCAVRLRGDFPHRIPGSERRQLQAADKTAGEKHRSRAAGACA